MENKYIIIVTGKSGSGKTEFSKYLTKILDAEQIDFDIISHLSLEDEKIKARLVQIFGEIILQSSGEINRKALGKIAFNDINKLKMLNSICQTFIENYVDKIINQTTKKYIVLEYALLNKMKYFKNANYKILITASDDIRFSRIIKRDNITMEYLKIRENHSEDYILETFDEIIENNANLYQNLVNFAEKSAKKIQTSIN